MRSCSSNSTSQNFAFDATTGRIKHQHSGLCVDSYSASANGGGVQLYHCDGGTNLNQEWAFGEDKYGPNSLYCWTFVEPNSGEPWLLPFQFQRRLGIFACTSHTVFSRDTGSLHGVATVGLGANPTYMCHFGPGTFACNTVIFKKAWKRIMSTGWYSNFQWTVKADADAAFWPNRLQGLIAPIGDGHTMFLANNYADPSMLGPIEVLSRGAVEHFRNNAQWCYNLPDTAGEDGMISTCMKILKIEARTIVPGLLNNENKVSSCGGPSVVFHKFKSAGELEACYNAGLR